MKILMLLINLMLTYVVGSYFDISSLIHLSTLLISVSSILLTMIGIWFAVVYNNILDIFTKDINNINENEIYEAKEFIFAIFYLAVVLAGSMLIIIVLHGLNGIALNNVIIINILFFLILNLLAMMFYVFKCILVPFGKLVLKLESKVSNKKINNSKKVLVKKINKREP